MRSLILLGFSFLIVLPAAAAQAPALPSSLAVPVETESLTSAPSTTETPQNELNISRESFDNPLVRIETNYGVLIAELFPKEAPQTVANFLGLANGTKASINPVTGQEVTVPFYDGLVFHRIVDGFMIQGGSPTGASDGTPGFSFPDEINARSLGLDKMLVLDDDGFPHPILGIQSEEDFQQQVLVPLYSKLGITSQAQLDARIDEVDKTLRELTIKENYENQGYRYTERVLSRMPVTGVLAMANSGPNSNGSQFFINLADTDWLAGKHTVFGKIRGGMDVLERIAKVPVDEQFRPYLNVMIYSIRSIEE